MIAHILLILGESSYWRASSIIIPEKNNFDTNFILLCVACSNQNRSLWWYYESVKKWMFCWNNYSLTAFTHWTRLKLQFIINDHMYRRCCCRDSVYQFINRWLYHDFRHATLGDIGIEYQNRLFIRLFSSVKRSGVELPIQRCILWLMNNVKTRIFDYFSDYKVKHLRRSRYWNLY